MQITTWGCHSFGDCSGTVDAEQPLRCSVLLSKTAVPLVQQACRPQERARKSFVMTATNAQTVPERSSILWNTTTRSDVDNRGHQEEKSALWNRSPQDPKREGACGQGKAGSHCWLGRRRAEAVGENPVVAQVVARVTAVSVKRCWLCLTPV